LIESFGESVPTNAFADSEMAEGNPADTKNTPLRVSARRPRRRRRRTNLWLLGLIVGLLGAYACYVFLLPALKVQLFYLLNPSKQILPYDLAQDWTNQILMRSFEFLFFGWFFYFGASVGSFLNLVAGRVPEGRTIVFGGSKCPFCDTRLSFLDNTPILGWLILQGKCRTCHLPIAARYVLIEAAVGTVFLWLAIWQLDRGGANLPAWKWLGRNGVANIVLDPPWPLIGAYLMHASMFAVTIMLATACMGKKPFPMFPLVLIAVGLSSGKLIHPYLDCVPWYSPFLQSPTRLFAAAGASAIGQIANPLISILLGGFVGSLVGWLVNGREPGGHESNDDSGRNPARVARKNWIWICLVTGSVLGWQSVVFIIGLCLPVYLGLRKIVPVGRPEGSHGFGLHACFIIIALVHHSMWRQIAQWMTWVYATLTGLNS